MAVKKSESDKRVGKKGSSGGVPSWLGFGFPAVVIFLSILAGTIFSGHKKTPDPEGEEGLAVWIKAQPTVVAAVGQGDIKKTSFFAGERS